jgi:hypothetical protein
MCLIPPHVEDCSDFDEEIKMMDWVGCLSASRAGYLGFVDVKDKR